MVLLCCFFVACAVARIKVAVNTYFGKSHQLFYRMADDSAGKQHTNQRLSKYLEEKLVKTPRLSKKRVKASSV